jgi:hypothetical protein
MLLKAAFVLLALSIGAILVAVGAMLWRLRWHLKRPHITPPTSVLETQAHEEPAKKA